MVTFVDEGDWFSIKTGADPATATITAAAAGNLLIVVAHERAGTGQTGFTCTDALGETWTDVKALDSNLGDASSRHSARVWMRETVSGDTTGTVITVDNGTTNCRFYAREISVSGGWTWSVAEAVAATSGTANWDNLNSGNTASLTGTFLEVALGVTRTSTDRPTVPQPGFDAPHIDAHHFYDSGSNSYTGTTALETTSTGNGVKSAQIDSTDGTGNEGIIFLVVIEDSAAATNTLTADTQTYTLTGVASNLNRALVLTADTQTYTLTGIVSNLDKAFILAADVAAYTVTGVTTNLNRGLVLTADTQSYTLSGVTTDLLRSLVLTADVQNYTLAGINTTLTFVSNATLTADTQAYTVSGVASGLLLDSVLTADTQAYTLSGVDTALNINTGALTADVVDFKLTLFDAQLLSTLYKEPSRDKSSAYIRKNQNMAKKPTLTDVTSGFQSSATLNANNDRIETAFDNTLSRDGSTPNNMQADIDLDDNDVINVRSLDAETINLNGASITASATTLTGTQTAKIGFDTRSASNATSIAALANGTIAFMAGHSYKVDSTKTGTASCTNDLSVNGIVPFGDAYPEHFGAKGDDTTNDQAALLAMITYLDVTTNPTKGVILNKYQVNAWTTYDITNQLQLVGDSKDSKITFTSPTGTDVFTCGTGITRFHVEGIDWVLTSTLTFATLTGATGTIKSFVFKDNTISGGNSMIEMDTTCTITKGRIVGNNISASLNGFDIDCLISHMEVSNNRLSEVVNSADVRLFGFKIGKDAGTGFTNQTSSSFFHIHDNTLDRIESTSSTTVNNQVNGIMVHGEDILIENNVLHTITSTRSTDVEAIYTKARRFNVRGNVCKNCKGHEGVITVKGLIPAGSATSSPVSEYNLVEGNIVQDGAFGIYLSTQADCVVRGNIITDTTSKAFWARNNSTDSSGQIIIENNYLDRNVNNITVEGFAELYVVRDNTIVNAVHATTSHAGIRYLSASTTAACKEVRIENNHIGSITSTSGTAYGIQVEGNDTYPVEVMIIRGNRFKDITTKPILFTSAGSAPLEIIIEDNFADAFWGTINSSSDPLPSFQFLNNKCVATSSADGEMNILNFIMANDTVTRMEAKINANGSLATEQAFFVLEKVMQQLAGTPTLIGTPVDTEWLGAGATTWDALVGASSAAMHIAVNVNDVTPPTVKWKAEINIYA